MKLAPTTELKSSGCVAGKQNRSTFCRNYLKNAAEHLPQQGVRFLNATDPSGYCDERCASLCPGSA